MKFKFTVSLLIAISLVCGLSADLILAQQQQQRQTPAKDEKADEIKRVNEFYWNLKLEAQDSPLKKMEKMRALLAVYPAASKELEHELLLTFMSQETVNLANYRDALLFDDFKGKTYPDDPSDAGILKDYRMVSAVEAITKAAAGNQVVMVNEAHHIPQHRMLTLELLKRLKKQGYKYFAAETLYETDTDLNKRGYPLLSSGAYMTEPIYGDVIRTALRLGYKVIPYDAPGRGGMDARERGAATNLKNRIFDNDPQAKVLVHVGFGHNVEVAVTSGKLLAGYLKEFTGIDPLTVEQTSMTEHSAPEYEFSLYRMVMKQYNPKEPIVFQNSKGDFWAVKNIGRDITVFSPRSVYANNRPTWLRSGGERTEYSLPKDICGALPPPASCVVSARFAEESADAVPIDQIEAKANQENVLLLPKGIFVVEAKDADEKKLKTLNVKK